MTTHTRLWSTVAAVGLAVLVLLAAVTIYRQGQALDAVRAAQRDAAAAADASQQTLEQLLDCSQPGGSCFQAARQQHATDVATFILGIGCSPPDRVTVKADRIVYTQRCVADYIRTHNTIGTPPRR